MTTVSLQETQAKLPEIIHRMAPGNEVLIMENNQPLARLVSEMPKKPGQRPPPGLGKGIITVIAENDKHLKDFEDYMP